MGGVKEQLNSLLLRYNEDLEGVVLSYTKERILSTQAKIHPYFPYFHVDVMALVFMFKPAVGIEIAGTVNAIGHDYIGVLVLGIFNAVIGRAQIPAPIQCRPLENCWTSSHDRYSRIEVGSELRFAVHAVDHASDFFTLSGSLLESDLEQQPPTKAQRMQQPAGQARQHKQKQWPDAAGREADTSAGPPAAAAQPDAKQQKAAATAAAAAGAAVMAAGAAGKQQPEHRKKSKRRDSMASTEATAGLPNGIDSAVKPPTKKKRKVTEAAALHAN